NVAMPQNVLFPPIQRIDCTELALDPVKNRRFHSRHYAFIDLARAVVQLISDDTAVRQVPACEGGLEAERLRSREDTRRLAPQQARCMITHEKIQVAVTPAIGFRNVFSNEIRRQ